MSGASITPTGGRCDGKLPATMRDPLRIPTIHNENCNCQRFVVDRLTVVGYHRIALRIQQSEKHNDVRKTKKK